MREGLLVSRSEGLKILSALKCSTVKEVTLLSPEMDVWLPLAFKAKFEYCVSPGGLGGALRYPQVDSPKGTGT